MARRKAITFNATHQFLSRLFGEDVHAKRVYSLANATLGVVSNASLAVNTIGQGLALARGKLTKHAGEALGYDRHLKSNTSKRRTHSLFRQGAMLYDLIPMMPEPRLRPLIERFATMLLELPAFAAVYGVI